MRYLDTSALAKLVLTERESTALRDLVRDGRDQVTAEIARLELPRATRRHSDELVPQARRSWSMWIASRLRSAEAAEAVGIPVEAPS
ncbi:MAG: hypothetical protein H0V93_12150 [Euzebyales bacterium]|nr:hypothetical protein [Euzebyales bacterium]